jgi:hypothetical protein
MSICCLGVGPTALSRTRALLVARACPLCTLRRRCVAPQNEKKCEQCSLLLHLDLCAYVCHQLSSLAFLAGPNTSMQLFARGAEYLKSVTANVQANKKDGAPDIVSQAPQACFRFLQGKATQIAAAQGAAAAEDIDTAATAGNRNTKRLKTKFNGKTDTGLSRAYAKKERKEKQSRAVVQVQHERNSECNIPRPHRQFTQIRVFR